MNPNLILVYHKPSRLIGDRIASALITDIKRELSGINVEAYSIRDFVSRAVTGSSKEEYVAALLLTRGGHYEDIENYSKNYAGFLGKIPNNLIANSLARVLHGFRCKRVIVVHKKAKRMKSCQDEDLREVMEYLVSALRARVVCSTPSENIGIESGDCLVSYTMFPSSVSDYVSEIYLKELSRRRIYAIKYLSYILKPSIIYWIKSQIYSRI